MLRRLLVGFVALACLVRGPLSGREAAAAADKVTARVSIFVGPQTRDGFVDVDSGVIDSIADIQEALRESRLFEVVRTAESATVILYVVARRTPGMQGGVGVPIGTSTMLIPTKRRAIDTILSVGNYQRAVTSEQEDNDTWRGAAKKVVKDVTVWVEANRAALK